MDTFFLLLGPDKVERQVTTVGGLDRGAKVGVRKTECVSIWRTFIGWPGSFAQDSWDGLRSLLALALPGLGAFCLLFSTRPVSPRSWSLSLTVAALTCHAPKIELDIAT